MLRGGSGYQRQGDQARHRTRVRHTQQHATTLDRPIRTGPTNDKQPRDDRINRRNRAVRSRAKRTVRKQANKQTIKQTNNQTNKQKSRKQCSETEKKSRSGKERTKKRSESTRMQYF